MFPENANVFNEAFWEGLSGLERQKIERFVLEICAADSLVFRAAC